MRSQRPEQALVVLAEQLRREDTVISPHVVEPTAEPALGLLCAGGPRAAAAAGEYSLVIEAVREGYLLHYGKPRLLAGHDDNLALLAGDYLYARGLERLAALGDTTAVGELSDLISISAECHAEGRLDVCEAAWPAAATAIGFGGSEEHEQAKHAARALEPDAAEALHAAAQQARSRAAG